VIEASTAGGSISSGQASFKLASVPLKPDPPQNLPQITNENQIGVSFGENLPENGGSQILTI